MGITEKILPKLKITKESNLTLSSTAAASWKNAFNSYDTPPKHIKEAKAGSVLSAVGTITTVDGVSVFKNQNDSSITNTSVIASQLQPTSTAPKKGVKPSPPGVKKSQKSFDEVMMELSNKNSKKPNKRANLSSSSSYSSKSGSVPRKK